MMGRTHAAIGAATPLSLLLTGGATAQEVAVMAVVSAAFSLLPDLDHQDSIASRALGGWSHQVAQSASKLALRLASTTRDVRTRRHRAMRGISPTHRTFTHTLLASFLLTSFVLLGAASSQIFVGVLSGAGVLLLRPVLRLPWLLTGVLSVTLGVGAYLWFPPVLLVLAAGGGYVGSILADGCTKQGVPLFWPMKINDKRWWDIVLLRRPVVVGGGREASVAVGVAVVMNGILAVLAI
jgi:membrane-bound metal-dependent hydrolase YbcI (DUF457 family)